MPKAVVTSALLLATMATIVLPARADLTPARRRRKAGCRQPAVPHESSLWFKQTGHTDPDDIYTWRWRGGSATAIADFGDPLTTTDYVLCFYDQSARPQPIIANLAVAATGWRALGTDTSATIARPARSASCASTPGADGKAAILAHGDTDTVQQLLPFTAPLVVQLQTSTGACWATTFTSSAPRRHQPLRREGLTARALQPALESSDPQHGIDGAFALRALLRASELALDRGVEVS